MVKVGTVCVCLLTACAVGCGVAAQDTDPLPSWNDSTAKKAIVDFVSKVTQEGGADFVPVSERIATFDNDGTLWAEQPVYVQVAFAFDRVKARRDDLSVSEVGTYVRHRPSPSLSGRCLRVASEPLHSVGGSVASRTCAG